MSGWSAILAYWHLGEPPAALSPSTNKYTHKPSVRFSLHSCQQLLGAKPQIQTTCKGQVWSSRLTQQEASAVSQPALLRNWLGLLDSTAAEVLLSEGKTSEVFRRRVLGSQYRVSFLVVNIVPRFPSKSGLIHKHIVKHIVKHFELGANEHS
jgi:hypothetical protein